MEEDFYATIKLKTGEEIFARVIHSEEEGNNILLINNPVMVNYYKSRSGTEGYKIEPWLKTTKEDLFVLNMNDVITITESKDTEMIMMHQEFINHTYNIRPKKTSKPNMSRRMGYISSVHEAKELLEKLYKQS
mgnify:CR=1 FL=1